MMLLIPFLGLLVCVTCSPLTSLTDLELGSASSSGAVDRDLLAQVYNLKDFPLGSFEFYVNYIGSGVNTPSSNSCLFVFKHTCGKWYIADRDRLLIWHKGKTMIDLIHEDGSFETVCLGYTLDDEECRFMVYMPIGTKNNIRPVDSAIISGVVIGGNLDNEKILSIQEIEDAHPNINSNFIRQNEVCYTQ